MSADEHRTDSIHGHVVRVSAEPKTAAKGGYLFRGLELVDGLDRRIFVIFPVFSGDDHYEFPLLCWEGARIAGYDLEFNNELEDGSVIYTATPESELILEPHRPISVTEAVDAAACIRSLDCRYRVGPEEPFWMAKGKLIHNLFEQLVHGGDKPSGRVFREAFQKALPAFMAVLPGSSITAHHKAVEEDARAHFSNLKLWLKKNIAAFVTAEVETDRMSTRLGLKGRADAIFHNGNRKMIVELKSGKVPVEDHFLQLFAYSLLFSNDNSSPPAEGYILYSATGNAEKLKDSGNRRKTILQGRNRAVALKYSYTVGRALLTELKCPRNGRCFSRSACTRLFGSSSRNQSALFNGVERNYYDRWFRLLSLDGWCQESEFARVLDPESLTGRTEERITVPVEELKIPDQMYVPSREDMAEQAAAESEIADDAVSATSDNRMIGQLQTELLLPDQAVELTPGEEVILHRGDPSADDAFRARVLGVDNKTVTVNLKVPFPRSSDSQDSSVELPSLKDRTGWFVDRVPFSRGREIARHALLGFFARGSSRVIHAVVQGDQTEALSTDAEHWNSHEDVCSSERTLADLNENQQAAVKGALNCDVYHLVHGPPGTGKTRVLARLIRMCLDRGERLLVACPTNVALDRLLVAVMDLGVREFLRVGVRANVSREFLRAVEKMGNPPVLLPDLALASPDFRTFKKHVSDMKLVGATAYQCAAHPLFLRKRFDRVIVDEAGQLDEPATLGPLALAPKFVLGGDHLQLPPVVKMKMDVCSTEAEAGLERSLFERLYLASPKSRISPLNMQYRMNLEVQDIPSRIFYDGALFPSPDVANRRLNMSLTGNGNPIVDRIIDPQLPVVFVNVEGRDSGKARPEEALAAGRIVRGLLACGVPPDEIGIITPYKAQQSLIQRSLNDLGHSARYLSVDTVDRFQGGEREVILVSLARSDSVTSFLADRKRLNVSLSRARSKLILLGYGDVLREHELFESILNGLECITFNPE